MRTLSSLHTRELLDYLACARKYGGWYSPYDGKCGYTIDEIKEELSKREHIPNKAEAKKKRQAAAKHQCSIERRRRK